ncbi:MAG: hypothetical protein K6D37_00270 [Prevotella sp.]|nr:hypothetical protein [Prevotella sp.]
MPNRGHNHHFPPFHSRLGVKVKGRGWMLLAMSTSVDETYLKMSCAKL